MIVAGIGDEIGGMRAVEKAFDLLDVENGIALHEGNFALDFVAGAIILGLGDAVGILEEQIAQEETSGALQTEALAGSFRA